MKCKQSLSKPTLNRNQSHKSSRPLINSEINQARRYSAETTTNSDCFSSDNSLDTEQLNNDQTSIDSTFKQETEYEVKIQSDQKIAHGIEITNKAVYDIKIIHSESVTVKKIYYV